MTDAAVGNSSLIGFDTTPVVAPPASRAQVARHRVLHLINGEHYAGAERVQDLLALNLGDLGFDVGFACLKPDKFAQLRRSQSSPLRNVPMKSRFDLRAVRHIARLMREEGYELLHTHSPRAALIGSLVARLTHLPWVHHLHSPTARDTTHAWRDWINARIERYSLRRAAAVIAVSHSIGDYALRMGVDAKRLAVVPNGVPCSSRLARWKPPRDAWTIGMVALFRERKGLEVLLESLSLLRRQGQHVRLMAVGTFESPEYETRVRRLATALGVADCIEWRGFCQDVTAELKSMDLFVLPSLFGEGLPMVMLEAMAAGTPVIATRVEGVPEVIRDECDGLIVPPQDSAALAAAIRRAIEADVDLPSMRQNAWHRQHEAFSDRSMAAGVARVYDAALAEITKVRDNRAQELAAADEASPPRRISILGVDLTDVSKNGAICTIESLIQRAQRCHAIYLVNAHTLNLASDDSNFRDVLNHADYVFGDGTGVRWAARQRGYRLRDNLVGTDLIPELFVATARRGYRYFLLGATDDTIARAAQAARERFAGWTLAGYHHGYVQDERAEEAIAAINASRADLLLVGMGNPLQEQWIARHRHRLRVPVAIGVGGLFDHWASNLRRAPPWVRRWGCEWMQLLLQQPHKWPRYLLGNPRFLYRMTRAWRGDRQRMKTLSLDV